MSFEFEPCRVQGSVFKALGCRCLKRRRFGRDLGVFSLCLHSIHWRNYHNHNSSSNTGNDKP